MNFFKNITIVFVFLILLNGCKKETKVDTMPNYGITFLKFNSIPTPDNYVVIYSSYTANVLDSERKNSYQVNVFAKFTNGGNTNVNRGNLKINNRIIPPGEDNSYQFEYKGKSYDEGRALFGKQATIELQGDNQFAASKDTVAMPRELITPIANNFPTSKLEINSNLNLTWTPDPNNEFHQVQVQVTYYKGLSQHHDPGMPNGIESLVYTVTDYGFFTIPSADLARFPVGAYVQLSILRASTNNTGDIAYLSVADAHSIPLLVVAEIAPLTANFSLSTSSTNPCSFTAAASVSGGYPSYNYFWSTYTVANPTPVEIGYSPVVTGTGWCGSLYSTNFVPPVGDQDTYITLRVVDSYGNVATKTKLLVFTLLEELHKKKGK